LPRDRSDIPLLEDGRAHDPPIVCAMQPVSSAVLDAIDQRRPQRMTNNAKTLFDGSYPL